MFFLKVFFLCSRGVCIAAQGSMFSWCQVVFAVRQCAELFWTWLACIRKVKTDAHVVEQVK